MGVDEYVWLMQMYVHFNYSNTKFKTMINTVQNVLQNNLKGTACSKNMLEA